MDSVQHVCLSPESLPPGTCSSCKVTNVLHTRVQARQLESLVRLAEARARVELRQVVTQQDALVRGRQHAWGEAGQGSRLAVSPLVS